MVALAKSKQNSNASVNKWKWCVCASSSSSNQASSMQIRDSASRLIELRLLLAKSYKNNDGFGDGVVVVVNQPVKFFLFLLFFLPVSSATREWNVDARWHGGSTEKSRRLLQSSSVQSFRAPSKLLPHSWLNARQRGSESAQKTALKKLSFIWPKKGK